ncbi:MAG: SHOCT domain-containing protein [Thermoplasmatales archaeon]|nr:SHOCT domain-containing protein [Thermoplasmatales archaeon]
MIRDSARPVVMFVMIQLFLLAIQFILGMWINLFAPTINTSLPPSPMQFMMLAVFSIPEMMVHMMNGIVIGFLAILILALSFVSGRYEIIALSFVNGALALTAGISGIFFLLGYMQNNILSFVMSLGFLGVILTDFAIMYFASANSSSISVHNSDALKILRNRYETGQIPKVEYDRMREDLEK